MTESEIYEALRVCYDTELAVNIVDLGLVYGVSVARDEEAPGFEPRYDVRVMLTMRVPNDEREALMVGQVRNRLAGIPSVSRSFVEVVWEPVWTAERMSREARVQLGLDRPAKQGLVSIKL